MSAAQECKHGPDYYCWLCTDPAQLDWTVTVVRKVRVPWEDEPELKHDCSDDNGGACDWDCPRFVDF
ncbi:hypothetical protein [Streptomyces sp. NPDC060366]|uniref:hypothetical protein n=1 Tax=Streptomyces sp. NPDC060366 TaxID=3347105 RepID=UPI003646AADB